MLRKIAEVAISDNHPFTEMWSDTMYTDFVMGYLDNLRRLIENDNR